MALKVCPKCSERYSDTYRHCPFCEEERAIARGKPIRREMKRRRQVSRTLPLLLLIALIGGGIWFGVHRGPALYASLVERYEEHRAEESAQILAEADARAEEEARLAAEQAKAEAEAKARAEAEAKAKAEAEAKAKAEAGAAAAAQAEPEPEPEPEPAGMTYASAAALPHGLTLNSEDETLFSAGEQLTLRASGGSGSYTWISEDESIVTVNENGMLTAVGGGTTHVAVTDGTASAICIVRVRGAAASGSGSSGSGSSAVSLNHSDFTIHLGESGVQLRVSGTDETPSFASANPDIASVSESGVVRAVGRGVTTVTATVAGRTLSCVVRVSS